MSTSVSRGRRLLGRILCGTVCAPLLVPPVAPGQVPRLLSAPVTHVPATDGCSKMAKVAIDHVDIVAATSEPAGNPPADAKSWYTTIKDLPAFCRVIGIARPSTDFVIGFELWLPTGNWNGRLHGIGIGGFAGVIDYDALASAIKGGQAGLATDTGHKGEMMESAWAKGHPEKVLDYGYRAIHASTIAGKRLIEAFYGRGPDHAYFVGCSGGGRQGLMEAARYPEDYDGVLAGAPAASWTDLAMSMANAYQAQLPVGAALRADQMPFLQAETIRQCDRQLFCRTASGDYEPYEEVKA